MAQVVEWTFAYCWFIESLGAADPENGKEAFDELETIA